MPPFLLLWSLLAGLAWYPADTVQPLAIPFYADTAVVSYHPGALPLPPASCGENSLSAWYAQMLETPWQPLHRSVGQYARAKGLNDWLHYQLLRESLEALLPPERPDAVAYFAWFYLGQSGLDPRLGCRQGIPQLYVRTRDTVYGHGLFHLPEGREYINLEPHRGAARRGELELYRLHPWSPTRTFTFRLEELPDWPPRRVRRTIPFVYRGDTIRLDLALDANAIDLLKGYPQGTDADYLHLPLSASARESLLPALRRRIDGLAPEEALRLLVAFTRTGFDYREDDDQFGGDKPMSAEETLWFAGSDCEDRCALLYQLVDELLGLPMIIIAYPRHLTLGVGLDEPIGDPVQYRGRAYTLCDPTGPVGSEAIGTLPERFKNQAFTVVGQ